MRPLLALLIITTVITASAAEPLPTRAEVAALITAGEEWLLAQQQPSGAFLPGNRFVLGVTELTVEALASAPRTLSSDDARLQRAAELILAHRQPDGGIYAKHEGLSVYGTALGLLALRAVDRLDEGTRRKAQDHLFGLQNLDPHSGFYGGIGYDMDMGAGAEDLHNTSTAVIALRDSGVPASDPRMQAVLHFLSMCQDTSQPLGAAPKLGELPKPTASVASARRWPGNSGGAAARPYPVRLTDANGRGGEDESGRKPEAYGSATYGLLTSYIALDLKPGDPRFDAALAWVVRNYRLDANPGLPAGREQDGLYYFHTVVASALAGAGVTTLALSSGEQRDWRGDLFAAIRQRVKNDGAGHAFWVNDSPRWGERLPHLCTVYTVRSLKRLHQSLPE